MTLVIENIKSLLRKIGEYLQFIEDKFPTKIIYPIFYHIFY